MSFALTTEQFKARTKTVTRRLGWGFLKPGDVVCGVEKGMGLKKGEKVNRLGLIEITHINTEPLAAMYSYGQQECVREGFPDMSVAEFIEMFCRHNKCQDTYFVNRIQFKYLPKHVFPVQL